MDKPVDKPIVARITDVVFQDMEPLYSEPITLQFYVGRTLHEEKFECPIFNEANLQSWRRLILFAVLGDEIMEGDPRAIIPQEYKNALVGKDAYIILDENVVYAIGRDVKKLFIPDLYDLFNLDPKAPTDYKSLLAKKAE